MGLIKQTIDQLEDELGLPIVLLTAWDPTTQKHVRLLLRDLPPVAIAVVVAWLNDRLP